MSDRILRKRIEKKINEVDTDVNDNNVNISDDTTPVHGVQSLTDGSGPGAAPGYGTGSGSVQTPRPVTEPVSTVNVNSNGSSQNQTDYTLKRTQILDPLSVIINLAILSYKPVNTKISISNNRIHIQETGIFQSFVRYVFRDNKYYLNLLYNPIEFACEHFLSNYSLNELPQIAYLFERALKGIDKLGETYKDDNTIRLCLNYYSSLIRNYLGNTYDDSLFKLDTLTPHYKKDLIQKLNDRWTKDKVKVITEMNSFLMYRLESAESVIDGSGPKYESVFCMETFMKEIDAETVRIMYSV